MLGWPGSAQRRVPLAQRPRAALLAPPLPALLPAPRRANQAATAPPPTRMLPGTWVNVWSLPDRDRTPLDVAAATDAQRARAECHLGRVLAHMKGGLAVNVAFTCDPAAADGGPASAAAVRRGPATGYQPALGGAGACAPARASARARASYLFDRV